MAPTAAAVSGLVATGSNIPVPAAAIAVAASTVATPFVSAASAITTATPLTASIATNVIPVNATLTNGKVLRREA